MKKILFILAFLPCLAYGQIVFHQGYMIVNDEIDVFVNINYELSLQDSMLMLPHKNVQIDSVTISPGIKNNTYVIHLHDGSHAYYVFTPESGHLLSILWTNGRLLLWENKQDVIKIER